MLCGKNLNALLIKKSLKISKELFEALNQNRTDNAKKKYFYTEN
jgi:hypothetical protein